MTPEIRISRFEEGDSVRLQFKEDSKHCGEVVLSREGWRTFDAYIRGDRTAILVPTPDAIERTTKGTPDESSQPASPAAGIVPSAGVPQTQ